MNIRHMLVPVDGSQTALKALELACSLAGRFDARLTLIHVIEDMYVSEQLKRFAEVEHLPDEPSRLHYEVVAKAIVDEARGLAGAQGVAKLDAAVVEGSPALKILDYADNNDVDTIVIGSSGLGRIEGLLLGSVSQKVNYLSKCTCITVK